MFFCHFSGKKKKSASAAIQHCVKLLPRPQALSNICTLQRREKLWLCICLTMSPAERRLDHRNAETRLRYGGGLRGDERALVTLMSATVSYSRCAWWGWKCCWRWPGASLNSPQLWQTGPLRCKRHPWRWPGMHFSWKQRWGRASKRVLIKPGQIRRNL